MQWWRRLNVLTLIQHIAFTWKLISDQDAASSVGRERIPKGKESPSKTKPQGNESTRQATAKQLGQRPVTKFWQCAKAIIHTASSFFAKISAVTNSKVANATCVHCLEWPMRKRETKARPVKR